jgi:hypothetical protein
LDITVQRRNKAKQRVARRLRQPFSNILKDGTTKKQSQPHPAPAGMVVIFDIDRLRRSFA